jgi:hypothetical protein
MDPKSSAKQPPPPACLEEKESQAEAWEPSFERWQRLTEALIADADRVSDRLKSIPRTQRV